MSEEATKIVRLACAAGAKGSGEAAKKSEQGAARMGVYGLAFPLGLAFQPGVRYHQEPSVQSSNPPLGVAPVHN